MGVINITDESSFKRASSPTWGTAGSSTIAKASSEYAGGSTTLQNGGTAGRNSDLLELAFPASTLDLSSYDPRATFIDLLGGTNSALALGADSSPAAEQYMGTSYASTIGTKHLTFENAPDLTAVDTTSLNLINSYVPDVSNGVGDLADIKAAFDAKYPAKSEAFPPAGATPADPFVGDTGLDLDARSTTSTSGLNPRATVRRLGDWTSPTLGRWTNDGTV